MTWLVPTLLIVVSLVEGSFLTALIHRLATGASMVRDRSRCPNCNHVLGVGDLIPVLSYLGLRGRCRYCHTPIHPKYPVIELTCVLVNVWAFGVFGLTWEFGFLAVTAAFLIIIFVYDLQHQLILDRVVLPGAAFVFIGNVLLGTDYRMLLLGGILGGGFFLLQYVISRGRWIGGGDIRLGLLMGALLGPGKLVVALFLSYLVGAVVGIGLIVPGKKKWKSAIPFGTFLSVMTFISYLYGQELLDWYLSLISF